MTDTKVVLDLAGSHLPVVLGSAGCSRLWEEVLRLDGLDRQKCASGY